MASHLTVISPAATHSFAAQLGAAPQAATAGSDALALFAALLGNTAPEIAAPTGQVTLDSAIGNVFALGLETGAGEPEAEAQTDITVDPVAAPVMAPNPAPVLNLVEALGTLKASLDAGRPLDPDLLKQVDTALTGLADALGLDLATLPVPEDFAVLLETGAEDTGLAGALTQLLAPLAQSIAVASKADDAASISGEAAALAKLKQVGDKLGAMLAALDADAVPDEKLAAIGMPPGQPPSAEINEALARVAAGLAKTEVPQEPELALPALKLTEPVLAGKTAESAEAPAPAAKLSDPVDAAPKPDAKPDQPADSAPRDRVEARREPANPQAFIAPTANEPAPVDPQASQQPATPRIDSAATTRVVTQPGYQTSQQQLNLPQIAFEMARQVEGGNTRFQIRLDPPELGRIDVRLEIDNAGSVSARLTVEKAETLDLMQRDQRGLERALQQAGVDAGKTNLEFSLKQNPFAGQPGMGDGQKGQNAGHGTANDNGKPVDETPEPTPTVNLYRGTLQARGVNIIA
ncbi:flagellar hook-length control protein FliK [Devosia rhizoryzae]|uniref:Flagellar hook-length control protein FliK n=1 Tax=Devosia rhizoryzae TaxID=2774137 RepID=A0ABX7C783_9HYPH|nr:flagellar hook-length control protein FliK [Devosia rhizoryzae]QQR39643.1 flagellar hook-length control protein FliK [Devosia rhizoryzae]